MALRRIVTLAAAATMLGTVIAVAAPVNAQPAPTCDGKAATIVGTDGNDRIEGTEGDDVIVGLAGKDVIFGRGGNDAICGGPGNDVIKGGRGNDYVEGNQGNDKLVGGIGRDTMDGGNHKDKLFGGGGPDMLAGNAKRDFLNGQNGDDTCDLDPHDRWEACETGDVVVYSGTGSATFDVDVPWSHLLYKWPTRGIIPQPDFYYFAVEFDVHAGQADVEVLMGPDDPSIPAVFAPLRLVLNNHESNAPDAQISGFDRPSTATVTARDHSPDAEWTVTFRSPDAIPYVPRTFTTTGNLIGQFEVRTRAGETFEWTLDGGNGSPYFIATGADVPFFPVDERFAPVPGPTQFTGDMPAGTRIFWLKYWGEHTFSVG